MSICFGLCGLARFGSFEQCLLKPSLDGRERKFCRRRQFLPGKVCGVAYFVSTWRMRISGYAPSQSGLTPSKMRRKSCSPPGASGAAETGSTSI